VNVSRGKEEIGRRGDSGAENGFEISGEREKGAP